MKIPSRKDTLVERSLTDADIVRILALEQDHRNHALLRLLYAGALRVSEIAALKWRDLVTRDDAGQVTVFGKGSKTRVVLLLASVWFAWDHKGKYAFDKVWLEHRCARYSRSSQRPVISILSFLLREPSRTPDTRWRLPATRRPHTNLENRS